MYTSPVESSMMCGLLCLSTLSVCVCVWGGGGGGDVCAVIVH